MKKGILAGLILASATLPIILLSGGDGTICPEECPGKHCQVVNGYCVVIDAENKPKRINDKAEVVAVNDLEPEKQIRPMVCCTTNEISQQENLSVRWAATVPANCHSWAEPSLYPGIEMTGVDLGHAKTLNLALCGKEEGPAAKGIWGPLPYCGYRCVDGRPVATPSGCDQFCNPPKEKEGPIGEWLPRGPDPAPPIGG